MDYQIVYIDESGFAQSVHRPKGYAPIGKRCYATYNWQIRKQTNAIGALLKGKLLTVGLFHHTINRTIFIQWLKEDLMPKLNKKSVLVMDNARFHIGEDIRQLVVQNGHKLLYLPAYSPDLNPIEQYWAYAKNIRRKYMVSNIESLFDKYL